MVKGMGESCFDDLLPWLMETLASEQSSVDRSGAAQGPFLSSLFAFCLCFYLPTELICVMVLSGLAEVMAGLGVEKLDKLMPDLVQTASKVDIASHVRDGYIMMFIYLPLTFGDKFTPYVGPIIPCILKVVALVVLCQLHRTCAERYPLHFCFLSIRPSLMKTSM